MFKTCRAAKRSSSTKEVLTLVFKLASTPRLALEFLAQLLQQLRQAVVWRRHHAAVCVIHCDRFREEAVRRLDNKKSY